MRYLARITRMSPVAALLLIAVIASSPALAGINFQQEMAMSDEAAKEIQKEYKLSSDAELTRIGRIIAWNSKTPISSFQMVETDEINAFALPGRIYFCKGLWDKLDEEQRAGILAHEISHVAEHHAIRQLEKDTKRGTFLAIVLIAIDANATQQDIASLAHALTSMKFSRNFEADADNGAINLTRQAGYDPHGVLRGLEKLKELSKGPRMPEFLSTHPLTDDRINDVRNRLAEIDFRKPSGGPKMPATADLIARSRLRLRQYEVELDGKRNLADLYESSHEAMVWASYAANASRSNVEARTTLGDAYVAAAYAAANDRNQVIPEWAIPKNALANALESYDAALRMGSASMWSRSNADRAAAGKVRVFLAQGDKEKAEQTARDYLRSHAQAAAVWAALGQALTARDRRDDAAEAYDRALRSQSADADALYDTGFGLLQIDQKPKAAEAFRAFLTRATDDPRREVAEKHLDSIR